MLLTIGTFAREAGLTPKALRLYDELGLLRPAAVDPDSGYRLYEPKQLRPARLVARLREIDMPLAEIRTVVGLPAALAAGAVDAYRQRLAATAAERARLAALLVDDLSGKDDAMAGAGFHGATRSRQGSTRSANQDVGFVGDRLLAIADGGGPGGTAAATAAVDALTALDPAGSPAEMLGLLAAAVGEAHRTIAALPESPISTLTALLREGDHLALVHVGDTRAYRLRDGELSRLTRDHTWVQTQVDAGLLDPDEAAAHPDRALLVRALGAGGPSVEADLALRTARSGDRYLLCTDGLSSVLTRSALASALSLDGTPDIIADTLLDLARDAGTPDDVSCAVAFL